MRTLAGPIGRESGFCAECRASTDEILCIVFGEENDELEYRVVLCIDCICKAEDLFSREAAELELGGEGNCG